jgi:hypothetical protein
VTAVATSNSQTFADAKQATAKAVSEAVASACGSGNVQAAASAAAQAVGTATAKAFAESSATVTVEGESLCLGSRQHVFRSVYTVQGAVGRQSCWALIMRAAGGIDDWARL